MKSYLIICILILLLSAGCQQSNPQGPNLSEEFQPGFYYYGNKHKIYMLMSSRIVSVKFEDHVSAEEAWELCKEYGLSPFYEIYELYDPSVPSWSEMYDLKYLVMLIPSGSNPSDYHTTYPKTRVVPSFGNIPEVKFCLPTYSFPTDPQSIYSRMFMGDEIVAESQDDSIEVATFVESLNLEVVRKRKYGVYTFRITDHTEMNTLDMANYLYEKDMFEWSTPNFMVIIVLEP